MLNEKEQAGEGARRCKSKEAEKMKNEGRGDRKQGAIFLCQFVKGKLFCYQFW